MSDESQENALKKDFVSKESRWVEIVEEKNCEVPSHSISISDSSDSYPRMNAAPTLMESSISFHGDADGTWSNQWRMFEAALYCFSVGIGIYLPMTFGGIARFYTPFSELGIAAIGKFGLFGMLIASIGVIPALATIVTCLLFQKKAQKMKTCIIAFGVVIFVSCTAWCILPTMIFSAPSFVSALIRETYILQSVCIGALYIWLVLSSRSNLVRVHSDKAFVFEHARKTIVLPLIMGIVLNASLLLINYVLEWKFSSVDVFLFELGRAFSVVVVSCVTVILYYCRMLNSETISFPAWKVELKAMIASALVTAAYLCVLFGWTATGSYPFLLSEFYLSIICSAFALSLLQKKM